MRTTLDLQRDLVSKAIKATKLKTKTVVIIAGLSELIRKQSALEIMQYHGKVVLEIDLDALRDRTKKPKNLG